VDTLKQRWQVSYSNTYEASSELEAIEQALGDIANFNIHPVVTSVITGESSRFNWNYEDGGQVFQCNECCSVFYDPTLIELRCHTCEPESD
jgi:hypothetical protein